MKRIAVLILLIWCRLALAQPTGNVSHFCTVSDDYGEVILTAVYVYLPGTTTEATIYADRAESLPITQPMTTSSTNTTLVGGSFKWYGQDGWDYKITTTYHTQDNLDSESLNASSNFIKMQHALALDNELYALASLDPNAYDMIYWSDTTTAELMDMSDVSGFNVKAYGADGNGVTDDTTAIQAAVDAAGTGGIVSFPPGTYNITTAIDLDHYITITGHAGSSIIEQQTNSEPCFENATPALINGVIFRGITFSAAGTGVVGWYNPGQYTAYSLFDNCEFYGNLSIGIQTIGGRLRVVDCFFGRTGTPGASWQAVDLDGTTSSVTFTTSFENCNFWNSTSGEPAIEVDNGNSLKLTSCVFEALEGPALQLKGVLTATLDNCNFENINASASLDCAVECLKNTEADTGTVAIFNGCKFQNNDSVNTWDSIAYIDAACSASFLDCSGSMGAGYYTLDASANHDEDFYVIAYNRTVSYGGSLDHNHFVTTQTVKGSGIEVANGATSAGYLDLYEDSDDGTERLRFIATAMAADVNLVWPADDGAASQYLQTNGSGALIWATPSGSGDMLKSVYDVLVDSFVDANDTLYAASWNGNINAPSMNAVYDKIETLGGSGDMTKAVYDVADDSFVDANDTTYNATSWNGNINAPSMNAVRDKIETLGGSGDMTKAVYDVLDDSFVDANDTTYAASWNGNINAPSMNAVYDKIELIPVDTDEKVGIDSLATADYIGAANSDGVLRVETTELSYADGGNFVTLGIADDGVDSAHYAAASIDNEHLADNAVDSAELAAGSVDDAHIADDVIQEPALNTTNAAGAGTDNYLLSYNDAGTNFTWVPETPLFNVKAYGADGNGVTDDTVAIQAAIDAAEASFGKVFFPKPSVAYGITDTLDIGDGTQVVYGWNFEGEGQGKIKWIGSAPGVETPMIKILSWAESKMSCLWLDGDDVANVTGIDLACASGKPGQRVIFENITITNCAVYGIKLQQAVTETCDFVTFDQCNISGCGVGLSIEGGVREVNWRNGVIQDSATYNVYIDEGSFTSFGGFFATAGTCDFYLDGLISCLKVYGGGSESQVIFKHSVTAEGGSFKLGPVQFHGFTQDSGTLPTNLIPCIEFDITRTLVLSGCKLQGHVEIGSNTLSVQSIATEWYTTESFSPAFTGAGEDVVSYFGYDNYEGFRTHGVMIDASYLYPDGIQTREFGGSTWHGLHFESAVPDSYYYSIGDVVFNSGPAEGESTGWLCTASGVPSTVKATFKTFGDPNLTSFVNQTAWRVFYSNTGGDVTELALGADGTYLRSNGAAAAPTFSTPGGSGDMLKSIYDVLGDDFVDANDTTYAASWNANINAPSMNAVYDKIETLGGSGDMTKAVYDVLDDGFVDANDTLYAASWNGNINAPSMNAVYDKIETLGSSSLDVKDGGASVGDGDIVLLDFDGGVFAITEPNNTHITIDVADDGLDSQHYVAGSIDNEHIADDVLLEAKLDVTNAPTDGYVMTYDTGTTGWTWEAVGDINDTVYGASWNGDVNAPSKNAVYDKIETLGGSGDMTKAVYDVLDDGFVDANDTLYAASWNGNINAPSMNAVYDKIETTQPLEATLTDIADGTIAENLVNTAFPWANAEVADDITLTNITQITTRSHTSLTDIGTNTHAQVDTHIADVTDAHTVSSDTLTLTNKTIDADGTGNVITNIDAGNRTAAANTSAVNFIIDGGGSAITTGIKGDICIPFACTITGVAVLGDQSGSIVIDLWQGTIAEQIAGTIVDADSITASDPPTVTTAIGSDDDTLTAWDATVNVLQVIRVNVDSCTTTERVTLVLKLTKT